MKAKITVWVRRWAGSICLSFAILAIANIQTIWDEYRHSDPQDAHLVASIKMLPAAPRVKHAPRASPSIPPKANFKPLQSELSQTLEEDELKDANPYSALATLDPLHQIMGLGVSHFHRETYRSPDYQDESGYDMVHYEIIHPDGRTSVILAYIDRSQLTNRRDVGTPDQGTPVVIFLAAKDEKMMSLTMFRNGQMTEQNDLSAGKAQDLISRRLSEGVPFLSVAR